MIIPENPIGVKLLKSSTFTPYNYYYMG